MEGVWKCDVEGVCTCDVASDAYMLYAHRAYITPMWTRCILHNNAETTLNDARML